MSILFGSPTSTHRVISQRRNRNSNLSKEHTPLGKLSDNTDEDYVCSLKPEDLVENGANSRGETPLYPSDAAVVELTHKRFSNISSIDICERLVVCNLSNNFLKDVSSLRWCVNLYCLDLHSNQITCLPDRKCWSALKKLTVLYLHDNGIGKLEELRDLSHAPNLINLTLYDTPISLKKNYRHCVVNAIWSLKALDCWVVSDEEIIEDAKFAERFKPMQPQFRFKPVDITIRESPKPTLRRYLHNIYKEVSAINRIQSRYCPVLVIQRMVRGYLIRLRYNYVMDTRLWAAISIQRCFRTFRGYPNPPPSTPLLHYQEFMYQSMSSIKLDYDAYVKMRRSIDPSLFSMKSVNFKSDMKMKNEFMNNKNIRKRLSINLEKLMGKATEICVKENSNYKSLVPLDSTDALCKERDSVLSSSPRKMNLSCAQEYAKDLGLNVIPSGTNRDHLMVGKYFTQFKFLGRIDQPLFPGIEEDVDFRLSIQKPPIMKHNQLEELVLRTVEGADDIRRAIKKIDRERRESVPKKVTPIKKVSARKFISENASGNMAFSCFRAIDKAYKDRASMEKLLKRTHEVKQMKELEDLSLQRIRAHKFNNRNLTSIEKKKNKVHVLNALEKRKQKDFTVLDKIDAKRNDEHDKLKKNAENYNFAIEFNCQNASVGKALANHDRSNRRDEETLRKAEHIDALRSVTEKKRDIINGYMKNLKLARQMENMCMKRDLHNAINEKAVEGFEEQVSRIKLQKGKKGAYMAGATLLPVKQFKSPVEQVDFL